jgi:hypothetical protein
MRSLMLVGAMSVFGLALMPAHAQAPRLVAKQSLLSKGSAVMLNPQPLPPKDIYSFGSRGGQVMLNPQPLPPKAITSFASRGSAVMLNPQPLPPEPPPEMLRLQQR